MRIVLTLHGKGGSVREPLLQYPVLHRVGKILKRIETEAVKHSDVIVFTSKGARALFESQYQNLLQDKDVRIVYPGIDLQELESESYRNDIKLKYRIKSDTFIILCIAKLTRDKGIDSLIEAIAALPESIRSQLLCLIVGRGELEEELQALIRQKGMQTNMKILGYISREELLGLMKVSNLFVLPSLVSVFDYALLEAGAMRLPIITTAVGGNLEMFDEGSAILIPPQDPPALASAITKMIANESVRNQYAQNAYQRICKYFSLQTMLDSYLAIYEDLLGRI
jgi:rhamnosyl/mannosyltransferase